MTDTKTGHANADCTVRFCPLLIGWRVLLGAGICLFLSAGLEKTTSILFEEILTQYEDSTVSNVSLMFSLKSLLQFFTAPLTAYLTQYFTYPVLMTFGSVLLMSAFLGSAFITNVNLLYLTISGLAGFGFGLATSSSYFLVIDTFPKNSGLAFGIITMMGSLGGMFYPYYLKFSFEFYGYSGGMVMIAALMSHCMLASLLYTNDSNHQNSTTTKVTRNAVYTISTSENQQEVIETANKHQKQHGWRQVVMMWNTYKLYTLYCISVVTTFIFSYISVLVHLLHIFQQKLHDSGLNADDFDISFVLVIMSCMDIVVRPVSGLFLDLIKVSRIKMNVYLLGLLLHGGAILLLAVYSIEDDWQLIALVLVVELFGTCVYTHAITVCMLIVPDGHHTEVVGGLRLFQGLGFLLGPYLTGVSIDQTGSALSVLYISGGVSMTGACVFTMFYNCCISRVHTSTRTVVMTEL